MRKRDAGRGLGKGMQEGDCEKKGCREGTGERDAGRGL